MKNIFKLYIILLLHRVNIIILGGKNWVLK